MNADFLFVCSEGWEKMTPTDKGAFCPTCKKEVIDFSDMKNKKVKEILSEESHEGELCGRFKTKQLLELNFGSFFKKFLLWNLRKRIALVFFFVLGSLMFSCSSVNGFKHEERLAGTVAYNDTTHPKQINPIDSSLNKTNGQNKK